MINIFVWLLRRKYTGSYLVPLPRAPLYILFSLSSFNYSSQETLTVRSSQLLTSKPKLDFENKTERKSQSSYKILETLTCQNSYSKEPEIFRKSFHTSLVHSKSKPAHGGPVTNGASLPSLWLFYPPSKYLSYCFFSIYSC